MVCEAFVDIQMALWSLTRFAQGLLVYSLLWLVLVKKTKNKKQLTVDPPLKGSGFNGPCTCGWEARIRDTTYLMRQAWEWPLIHTFNPSYLLDIHPAVLYLLSHQTAAEGPSCSGGLRGWDTFCLSFFGSRFMNKPRSLWKYRLREMCGNAFLVRAVRVHGKVD